MAEYGGTVGRDPIQNRAVNEKLDVPDGVGLKASGRRAAGKVI